MRRRRADSGEGSGRGGRHWWPVASMAVTVVACGQVDASEIGTPLEGPGLVTIGLNSETTGPDSPPRIGIARRSPDGTLVPVAGEYIDAVEFRHGLAAVSRQRELTVVHSDGSWAVLAREVDGWPARTGDGALAYAARYGEIVEIHWLTAEGKDLRLASLRGSAARLAPQQELQVVFVGSRLGGVAGVWLADRNGARCLTNCDLRAGEPWGDHYTAPPGDSATVHLQGQRVEWRTPTGVHHTASLEGAR